MVTTEKPQNHGDTKYIHSDTKQLLEMTELMNELQSNLSLTKVHAICTSFWTLFLSPEKSKHEMIHSYSFIQINITAKQFYVFKTIYIYVLNLWIPLSCLA